MERYPLMKRVGRGQQWGCGGEAPAPHDDVDDSDDEVDVAALRAQLREIDREIMHSRAPARVIKPDEGDMDYAGETWQADGSPNGRPAVIQDEPGWTLVTPRRRSSRRSRSDRSASRGEANSTTPPVTTPLRRLARGGVAPEGGGQCGFT